MASIVELLIEEKGYEDGDLPSNEAIRLKLHALGLRLRKVRKAAPKKLPETDAIFEHIKHVNRAADESPTELRLSLDAKAQVKVGPLSGWGGALLALM